MLGGRRLKACSSLETEQTATQANTRAADGMPKTQAPSCSLADLGLREAMADPGLWEAMADLEAREAMAYFSCAAMVGQGSPWP